MTLQELKDSFGSETGFFYKVSASKLDIDLLTDADQTVHTIERGSDMFIRVEKEFEHPDYIKVEE